MPRVIYMSDREAERRGAIAAGYSVYQIAYAIKEAHSDGFVDGMQHVFDYVKGWDGELFTRSDMLDELRDMLKKHRSIC